MAWSRKRQPIGLSRGSRARAAWVLNTASDEVKLSGDARGPEYMLMLTQVLEGEDGLGRDFDFVYFVGPSEFAKFFGLKGANDLEILEAYYDRESPADPKLRQIDKREFRNYYGLRASMAASRGSHDEWNIVRLINERRRHEQHRAEFGMARQLSVLFDGRARRPRRRTGRDCHRAGISRRLPVDGTMLA